MVLVCRWSMLGQIDIAYVEELLFDMRLSLTAFAKRCGVGGQTLYTITAANAKKVFVIFLVFQYEDRAFVRIQNYCRTAIPNASAKWHGQIWVEIITLLVICCNCLCQFCLLRYIWPAKICGGHKRLIIFTMITKINSCVAC